MDPITLALLGSTAISGIGSLLGASSAGDTAAANKQIASQNFQLSSAESQRRQQEFQQAMDLAKRQYGDTQQGMTTGSGSSVKFVPGQGWVTTLGPIDQVIQARGVRTGGAADRLLEEFQRYQPISGERMSGLLYDKAIRGLNDTFSGQEGQNLRTATRQSNPQLAAAIISAIGKQRGEAYKNAAVDSEIEGRKYADTVNAGNRGSLANLYAAMSGQAAGEVGPDKYIPTIANAASGAGKNLLATAMSDSSKAPQMATQQADNSLGSALASTGQLAYGAARDYSTSQKQDQYLDALRKRYATDTNWNSATDWT
jgi:hypothetical protein